MAVLGALLCGQTPVDVGSGAPTLFIQQLFQSAFFRNGFANSVALPPLGNVKKVGANGLVQEFSDSKNTPGLKLALVMPNSTVNVVEGKTYVFQFQSVLYAYWTSVGATTAGMPVMDTAACPQLVAVNTCQYQIFDKPYALFVYGNLGTLTGTNFFIRDPYYTKWTSYGGIGTMGPPNTAETAVTSVTNAAATAQIYDRGAIYNFTTGVNTGRQIGVKQPIWDVYLANGGHVGQLGFPTSEELITSNGRRRQGFENGAVEYDPVTQAATFLPAVRTVNVVAASSTVRLKIGETSTAQAYLADSQGNQLTGREVLWSTSNGRVVSVTASGTTATIKGIGGGSATVRASSEGKSSAAITVVVTAQCCGIGEGAPNTAITQSFADAVTRNHLNLALPSASAVVRIGAGYVQQFTAADGSGPVWIVVPDKVATGVVIAGRFLAAWLAAGGASGQLGYPVADATAGGRQMFETGALAGDPVQFVSGDILSKWGSLGFETAAIGLPLGPPQPYTTFRASQGQAQLFRGGVLYQVAAAKVYAVAGLILVRYSASGAAAGRIGAPVNDEYTVNGKRRQDFEGGFIDYAPTDSVAQLTENARLPVVTATPSVVTAGTSLRLAAGGFDNGTQVRVSITGQADFVVTVASGAYVWDAFVAATAKSASVTVRAVSVTDATKTAQATYTIRASTDVRPVLAVVAGDDQTGVPGGALPLPLRISVKDDLGSPLPGVAVLFSASPGARIDSSASVTDGNGEATAILRLSTNQGIALATARAAGQVVTFSSKAASLSLSSFPHLSQSVDGLLGSTAVPISQKGAMLTAAAAILRYHQVRGELPVSGGLADPNVLNESLKTACSNDASGAKICDGYLGSQTDPIVNLWRLGLLVGHAVTVSVEKPDLPAIRDLLAQGWPVLLALSLSNAQTQFGAHFVVATGVGSAGEILIMDPNPAFARNSLADYTNGFAASSGPVSGVLTGAVRLLPVVPAASGFLVAVTGTAEISSPIGTCGTSLEFPSFLAVAGVPVNSPPLMRLHDCEGTASSYELDVDGSRYEGVFEDLGPTANRVDISGAGAVAFNVVQNNSVWQLNPSTPTIFAGGVVNAADFSNRLAPGTIATVFGGGLGRPGAPVTAEISGAAATVLNSSPFQVNLRIPLATPSGAATLTLNAPGGSASQTIQIVPVAPAVFMLGSRGAVINRDGSVNGPSNPALRGDVMVAFGTGFGSVSPKGTLMITDSPVTAKLGDLDVPVQFAGLTPGFVGLYQINLSIPMATPPGLRLILSVKQENITGNPVEVAIQ